MRIWAIASPIGFIERNVLVREDLPAVHAGATSALGAPRIVGFMQEHRLSSHDEDRGAALDILLLLADAEARWNNHGRALDLLDEAEHAGCVLSPEYEMKRLAWFPLAVS